MRIYFIEKRKISRSVVATVLLVICFFYKEVAGQASHKTPANIHLADPTIFYNNGIYYLYGTVEGNANNGFIVYTSNDIKNWKKAATVHDGYALKKGEAYGGVNFWAPQVFRHKDSFYMAYVADEHIAIATGKDPAGPFSQKEMLPLAAPVKQIFYII